MGQDFFSSAMNQAVSGSLSVVELTRAVDEIRRTHGPADVRALYEAWLHHSGGDPVLYAVLFNYSVILTDLGEFADARACLERAIALKPDFMPPYINLGRLHERQGALDQAILQWQTVVGGLAEVNEQAIIHKTTALNQMARVLESRHQDDAAETMLRQSVEIDRTQREPLQHLLALRQRQCKWPIVVPSARIDRQALSATMSPLSLAAYADDPLLQLAASWNHNKSDVGTPDNGFVTSHWAATEERRDGDPRAGRLRIGYLSSDLRGHAVGYLLAELFQLHDRSAVEVFAYYCGPEGEDALQARIKAGTDHWMAISSLDDAAAARRVADDGIQILVDLNGYTKDARTRLLALRPAPLIVNWLGFPGSMASPYHHYIIADDWIIPPEYEIYYSETVLRLACYQPNDRQRMAAARTPTRQEVGLPADAMVYCCFNGAHKITRFTFDRWLTILQRVPGSVLWLLASTEPTEARLRDYAVQRGLASDRLVFAPKLSNPDHLARYPLADLFLDTSPYGAHTTASDALWMGLPVLTQSGLSFAARVCGSLVRAAGLPELDCRSADEYVDRAVAIGRDRTLAVGYRHRLIAARDSCRLFDTPDLVRRLEGLYRQIWSAFRDGRRPSPDLSNLDIYLEVGSEQDFDQVEVVAGPSYRAGWVDRLARRHAVRPIASDRRLWTKAVRQRRQR